MTPEVSEPIEEGIMPYRQFLEGVLPSLGLQVFIVQGGLSGVALDDIVGGHAPRQPPWGLSLSQVRIDQLTAGLSKPTVGKGTGSASTIFKMPPPALPGNLHAFVS